MFSKKLNIDKSEIITLRLLSGETVITEHLSEISKESYICKNPMIVSVDIYGRNILYPFILNSKDNVLSINSMHVTTISIPNLELYTFYIKHISRFEYKGKYIHNESYAIN